MCGSKHVRRGVLIRVGAALLLTLVGCGTNEQSTQPQSDAAVDATFRSSDGALIPDATFPLDAGFQSSFIGAHNRGIQLDEDGTVHFRLYAPRAERVELWLYREAMGAEPVRVVVCEPESGHWEATLSGQELDGSRFYGYRLWGPNWTFDLEWEPGSDVGFVVDVDEQGNRFNPNKLVADPYALMLSHDSINPDWWDGAVYASGPEHRNRDSGPVAPKGVMLKVEQDSRPPKPVRPFRDEVIYEVHLRGFTNADASLPEDLRGTYAGAATKARYLRELGVTAIELLPVHSFDNSMNDIEEGTFGDDYWGYVPQSYFALERRYASAEDAAGVIAEFQSMVDAFHREGIKVYLDVVYNHTGEGNNWDGTGQVAAIRNLRGIANTDYYQLADNAAYYYDNNGVGPNLNVARPVTRDLVVDSLRYASEILGVDGFRFDLASVLGNRCEQGCFEFDAYDSANLLNRIVRELPARPEGGGVGVDVIAEPWAIGDGTYQLGQFPAGWAEWNASYRDTLRASQNLRGVQNVSPGSLAELVSGSKGLFGDDGRKPWHSVNFLVAHDGFTLADLYRCNDKNNDQPWPYGPSDGGHDHNISWDQGGDLGAQRKAARTGMALLAVSAGVPMMTGGDELLRSRNCNNNAYNLDSEANWLSWEPDADEASFREFTRALLTFRNAHPSLRPSQYFSGRDDNGNGRKDIEWLHPEGGAPKSDYLSDSAHAVLGWMLDPTEWGEASQAILVYYNAAPAMHTVELPRPPAGTSWQAMFNTAEESFTPSAIGSDERIYSLAGRSVFVAVAE